MRGSGGKGDVDDAQGQAQQADRDAGSQQAEEVAEGERLAIP